MRGEYTEIESVHVANGTEFKVESAATESGNLSILITTLALPKQTQEGVDTAAPAAYAVVTLAVPEPYKPRVCNVTAEAGGELRGDCPGLPAVRVSAAAGTAATVTSSSTLQVALSPRVGGQVALQASLSLERRGAASAGGEENGGTEEEARASVADVGAVVSAARGALLQSFAHYGARNETFAGMQTSISWNVIYTPYEGIFTPPTHPLSLSVSLCVSFPLCLSVFVCVCDSGGSRYEGIFTPVFRGSPWAVSKPHNYVPPPPQHHFTNTTHHVVPFSEAVRVPARPILDILVGCINRLWCCGRAGAVRVGHVPEQLHGGGD